MATVDRAAADAERGEPRQVRVRGQLRIDPQQRAAGGLLVSGTCFYLMTPRELGERFGYHTIVTDSAKLANIIAGYDYNPVLRPTEVCLQAALNGRLPW